jgi:hypothetical protein
MLTSLKLQREIACIIVYVECKYENIPIIQKWAAELEKRPTSDITLYELNFLLDLAEEEPYELALLDLYKLHQKLGKPWVFDTIPSIPILDDCPENTQHYPF